MQKQKKDVVSTLKHLQVHNDNEKDVLQGDAVDRLHNKTGLMEYEIYHWKSESRRLQDVISDLKQQLYMMSEACRFMELDVQDSAVAHQNEITSYKTNIALLHAQKKLLVKEVIKGRQSLAVSRSKNAALTAELDETKAYNSALTSKPQPKKEPPSQKKISLAETLSESRKFVEDILPIPLSHRLPPASMEEFAQGSSSDDNAPAALPDYVMESAYTAM